MRAACRERVNGESRASRAIVGDYRNSVQAGEMRGTAASGRSLKVGGIHAGLIRRMRPTRNGNLLFHQSTHAAPSW
jgi:hypothetical protein